MYTFKCLLQENCIFSFCVISEGDAFISYVMSYGRSYTYFKNPVKLFLMLQLVCPYALLYKLLFLLLWLIITSANLHKYTILKVVNALIYPFCVTVCIYVRGTPHRPLPVPIWSHPIVPHYAHNSACVAQLRWVCAHSAGNYKVIQSVRTSRQMI